MNFLQQVVLLAIFANNIEAAFSSVFNLTQQGRVRRSPETYPLLETLRELNLLQHEPEVNSARDGLQVRARRNPEIYPLSESFRALNPLQHQPEVASTGDWFQKRVKALRELNLYERETEVPSAEDGLQERERRSPEIYPFVETVREVNLFQHDPEVPSVRDAMIRKAAVLEACATVTRSVRLQSAMFEYRPDHYVETSCKTTDTIEHGYGPFAYHSRCMVAGAVCVQRKKIVHVLRRAIGEDCWEIETRRGVASGCDCVFVDPR